MKTQISKIKFRRGSDIQSQDVIFDEGEPAYTTDSSRLIIGDGVTKGGSYAVSKHWDAPTIDSIAYPRPNDIALIGETLWWYKDTMWYPIAGADGRDNPNPNAFETISVPVTSYDTDNQVITSYRGEFNIRFAYGGPLTADETGVNLQTTDNFFITAGKLDVPFNEPLGVCWDPNKIISETLSTDISGRLWTVSKPTDDRDYLWKNISLFFDTDVLTTVSKTISVTEVSAVGSFKTDPNLVSFYNTLTGTYHLSDDTYITTWKEKTVQALTLR